MSIKFDNSLQLKYVNQFEVGDHCFRTMDFGPTCVQGLQGPIPKYKHQHIIRLLMSHSDFA